MYHSLICGTKFSFSGLVLEFLTLFNYALIKSNYRLLDLNHFLNNTSMNILKHGKNKVLPTIILPCPEWVARHLFWKGYYCLFEVFAKLRTDQNPNCSLSTNWQIYQTKDIGSIWLCQGDIRKSQRWFFVTNTWIWLRKVKDCPAKDKQLVKYNECDIMKILTNSLS